MPSVDGTLGSRLSAGNDANAVVLPALWIMVVRMIMRVIVGMSVIVAVTGHFNAFLGSEEMLPPHAASRPRE